MQTQGSPNRLKELIAARGIKLAHLASHCDVDQSTVYRWRMGHTPIPDEQKATLAAYFGVTRSNLMGWDEPEPDELEPERETAYTRGLTVQVSCVGHGELESDTRTEARAGTVCDHCGFPTATPPDQRGGRYCCDRCRRSDEANPARSAL